MKEIIIIFTAHKEFGAFSSSSLIKILEALQPDLIFLEASPDDYHQQFVVRNYDSLESKALFNFQKTNDVDIIPTGTSKSKEFLIESHMKYQRLNRAIEVHSTAQYRGKYTQRESKENMEGFAYINSEEYGEVQKELNLEEKIILEETENIEFIKLYEWWHALHDERESEMLTNINNHCLNMLFEKAVFLIGAEHRNSIINKTKELVTDNIKWRYHQ